MSSAQMLVSLEKVTKIKEYFICCDIILKIEDKEIFYLLRYYSEDRR